MDGQIRPPSYTFLVDYHYPSITYFCYICKNGLENNTNYRIAENKTRPLFSLYGQDPNGNSHQLKKRNS